MFSRVVQSCGGTGALTFHLGGIIGGLSCCLSGIIGISNVKSFENFVTSIYSMVFGGTIFLLELYQPSWFVRRFGFYDTMSGRGFFILSIGFLSVGSSGFQRFLGAVGVLVAILYLLLSCSLSIGILDPSNPKLA